MNAILGKVSSVREIETSSAGTHRVEISFTAVCVLPQREPVPEWLKGQTLKLERELDDLREVGQPGDSLVLTVEESAKWLMPLLVTPEICHGELPETIALTLLWWKDEKGPDYTVSANGITRTRTFTKNEGHFTAQITVADYFTSRPLLPVEIKVVCDKIALACTVLPAGQPYAYKLTLRQGELYRIENGWYCIDIVGNKEGGGISAWREHGRGVDHFHRPEHLILRDLQTAGHIDRYQTGWKSSDRLLSLAMTCGGIRHEDGLTRLFLEGLVDEGQNLRTTVTCQVLDEMPLLMWQREFHRHTGKKNDEKEKSEQPREPIDDVLTMGLNFRTAWVAERDGDSGSRVLCAYDDQLVTIRSATVRDIIRAEGWQMSSGWAVVEHPLREECMLYLFDREKPPFFRMWTAAQTMTLEPSWLQEPARPGDSFGFQLGISAGERCGAVAEGAWLACRAALPQGGVRCGVIARLQDTLPRTGTVTLGSEARDVTLAHMLLPGIGKIQYAVVDFPAGALTDSFDAVIATIPSRQAN